MGKAIWLYLEMLDKITLEDAQDVGWLLGRKPINCTLRVVQPRH
jgi:hypothetical protein